MSSKMQTRRDIMDTPSNYLIRVIGELDNRWLEYFGELSIAVNKQAGICTSTICSHDADQATVMGLLNSLYDHGYPLIYFQKLEPVS